MNWTITRTDRRTGSDIDIDIEVEYVVRPGCRGRRDSLCGVAGAGPALEPDEPATVEIISAKDAKGNEVSLSAREEDDIRIAALERDADAAQDYPEPDER